MSTIKDISLAPEGEKKIAWVERNMPLLRTIREQFEKDRPFEGKKITLSVHLEAKTAYLCRVMEAGGAEMHITGSNPLSTQDDVAAALVAGGMDVHAIHGCTVEEYEEHLEKALIAGPHIIIDDGGDLVRMIHTRHPELLPNVIGSCEETTTGIIRLKQMAQAGELRFPAVMVNDADCKHFFDNRYGTGQSVLDGIMRTTNLIVAGKNFVVAGYGWCGKGVAKRADGMGARVIVTEVDPVRAIEAVMDGYQVMSMQEAAKIGDIFCTLTGDLDVITEKHYAVMKDGALLCNAGHFDVELNLKQLEAMADSVYDARNNIKGYRLKDGRTLFVLAEGRLVNLASGDGHPAEIMDMSFAIQALCSRYLVENAGKLETKPIPVPAEINRKVADLKLQTLGIEIDHLEDYQKKYIGLL